MNKHLKLALGLAAALLIGIFVAPKAVAAVLCVALGIEAVALIHNGMTGQVYFGVIDTSGVSTPSSATTTRSSWTTPCRRHA